MLMTAPQALTPRIETGRYRSLEPRVRTLWIIGGFFSWLPILCCLGAAAGWVGVTLELWDQRLIFILGCVGAVIGGPLLSILMPPLMFRRWGYQLAQGELRLRRGVVQHTDTWVPYSRIQYVELRQGLLERKFRLSSLVVHTAGSEGAQVVLPGLDLSHGEELRRLLLGLIEHERP